MKGLRALALLAVSLALGAHFGVFYFLGIRAPIPRQPELQILQVAYTGTTEAATDPLFREQAILLDSAPLFMPTRWNLASEMSRVASLQQATEVFAPFEPLLFLPEAFPPEPWQDSESAEAKPPPLPQGSAFVLSPLGRTSPVTFPGSSGSPTVEVVRLSSDTISPVRSIPLPLPLDSGLPPGLWTPARFYLQLIAGFRVGPPLLVQSTGFSDWDAALKDYLGSLDFHHILEPGYYQISVFP